MPIWPQLAILQLKWRENSNVSKVGKIQINYKYFSTQSVPTTAKFMDVSSIQAAPGTGCPKCGGEVFHAERMFSKIKWKVRSAYSKPRFSLVSIK